MSKLQMAEEGKNRVIDWCKLNGVNPPKVFIFDKNVESRLLQFYHELNCCVFYRESSEYHKAPAMYIMYDKCAHIGRAASAWAYPGYVIDRTPYGVCCHELGHHIDWIHDWKLSAELKMRTQEDWITGYRTNDGEWFAEMFRLFVTNPDLLSKIRPKTYDFLIAKYPKHSEDRSWKTVLRLAPIRTIKQATKKIRLNT